MTEIESVPSMDVIKKKEYRMTLSPEDASSINGVRITETKEMHISTDLTVMKAIGIGVHEAGHNASDEMSFADEEVEATKKPLTYEEAQKATIDLTDEEVEYLREAVENKPTLDDLYWDDNDDIAKGVIAKLVSTYTRGNYKADPEKIHFEAPDTIAKRVLGGQYDAIKEGRITEVVVTYSREQRNNEAAAMQVEHGCMTILENTLKAKGVDYVYVDRISDSPSHDRAQVLVDRVWKRGCMLPSQLDYKKRAEEPSHDH
jgi:hypothetical protein